MKIKDLSLDIHSEFKKMGLVKRQDETKKIVDIVFDKLREAIYEGHTVGLKEIGTFSSELKMVNNPQDPTKKVERWVIKFKTAWLLKRRMNEKINKIKD